MPTISYCPFQTKSMRYHASFLIATCVSSALVNYGLESYLCLEWKWREPSYGC